MRYIFCLTLVLILSSCANLTKARESNLRLIQVGQSRSQVVNTLGNPTKRFTDKSGAEIWQYDIYSSDSARTYPYTAKFEGEVLRSFSMDSVKASDDAKFREDRKTKGLFLDVNGTNGAPPIQGAD